MKVLKFNVVKPQKWVDKQGVEKTKWHRVGEITEFHKDNGSVSRIIEIPAIGLEANIFPFEKPEAKPDSTPSEDFDFAADPVKAEDVPLDTDNF